MDRVGHNLEISPFELSVDQEQLDDLYRRLDATRWPFEDGDDTWAEGMPTAYARELASYWRHDYDWRAWEARLNQFAQFTTPIDGHDVHFIHVRSAEPGAIPLVMTHGWPGSIVEFVDVIGPLIDPVAHGGRAEDAFHVVVPTIPGFGISGPATGWSVARVADAWAELMARLGYVRYVAHGGDYGSAISRQLGLVDAEHVAAVHLTALLTASASPKRPAPDDPDEAPSIAMVERYQSELGGYATIQSTKPRSVAYGLGDSPVGLMAWIVERFKDWTDSRHRPEDAVERDAMLTNVMIYWLFNTAGSSARYYYEARAVGRRAPVVSSTPTSLMVMPADIARPVRTIAETTDHIVRWEMMPRGGHFAAMEVPDLLVDDLRTALRPIR